MVGCRPLGLCAQSTSRQRQGVRCSRRSVVVVGADTKRWSGTLLQTRRVDEGGRRRVHEGGRGRRAALLARAGRRAG